MELNERFENRLGTVERQGVELTHRVGGVEGQLRHLASKVDNIGIEVQQVLNIITKDQATPKFQLKEALSTTKDVAILVGLLATLFGFLINSYGASDRAVLNYRVNQLEKRADIHGVQTQSKTDRGP